MRDLEAAGNYNGLLVVARRGGAISPTFGLTPSVLVPGASYLDWTDEDAVFKVAMRQLFVNRELIFRKNLNARDAELSRKTCFAIVSKSVLDEKGSLKCFARPAADHSKQKP